MLRSRITLLVMIATGSIAPALDAASGGPSTQPATVPTTTASYAGTFSNDKLTVALGVAPLDKAKAGEYVGTFTLGGKTYDATASQKGGALAGTFRAGGNPFQFTATLEDGGIQLLSGGTTYHLKNLTPPAAAPATMPAASPATLPAAAAQRFDLTHAPGSAKGEV